MQYHNNITTYTPQQVFLQSEMLANRVKKNQKRFKKRYKKENIECYRLYDWDIPEVRVVVDWYKGHLVIAEYERTQTGTGWLETMAKKVAEVMNIDLKMVHLKRRITSEKRGEQYGHLDNSNSRFIVAERDLQFWINPGDFLDTGLYSDHRNTRKIVSSLAKDCNFLNLFAYTGAFTCAALLGGATKTTTVDRNQTYLDWAKDNVSLNKLSSKSDSFIQTDIFYFLDGEIKNGNRYSLAVVDPPSYFTSRNRSFTFDINGDHILLLKRCLKVMEPGGIIFFSTNHQRFEPQLDSLNVHEITEITPATIPDDYRNKKAHRCWKIVCKT